MWQRRSRSTGRWHGHWQRWLDRRLPPQQDVVLGHRQLFILPDRQLGLPALLWLALILAAINYQNAMVHALAFLLVSCFVVAIGHTWRNLAGLQLLLRPPAPVHAGATVYWPVHVQGSRQRRRHGIRLGFQGNPEVAVALADTREAQVAVPLSTRRRGWLWPPRLRVSSRWPLGWLYCWSLLAVPWPVLVYPTPAYRPLPGQTGQQVAGSCGGRTVGDEDVQGWRDYRPGDRLRDMAWKAYARSGELLVVTRDQARAPDLWLDWQAVPELEFELRLQVLCGWVLQAAAVGARFGLRLPDATLPPARGSSHEQDCLRALALCGDPAGDH